MKLPPPSRLGLKGFSAWRKGQDASVLRIVDCPKRFPALVAPTGAGKSLIVAASIRLLGGKWVYLTSTKSLQDQISREFASLGWLDVRGQSNYECLADPPYTVDLGPCHAGQLCDLKSGGCTYYDAVRASQYSTGVTITNYAWWLSNSFPPIDGLVLDEAHNAPDEVAGFLSWEVSRKDIGQFFGGFAPPPTGWPDWAVQWSNALEVEIESFKSRARGDKGLRKTLRRMMYLQLKLVRLRNAKEDAWVLEETKYGWRFDPVWPGPYCESMLFRNAPKVILVSATIRPKTLQLLGLKEKDYDFGETQSSFPLARRPVIHFSGQPRVALTYRSSDAVLKLWLARIDNIIRRRLDRKGIIHCVSYARRDLIIRNSRYRDLMLTHDSGEQAAVVEKFKNADPPRIFLSPSATTGLDFPYDQCEYSIVAKVPFPDQRSKILKARAKGDPEYAMYLTMLDVVQASGRGMRAADDSHEVFLVDDQWGWFHKKFRRFAPSWFLESCRRTESIPDPPPKLSIRGLTGSETVVRSET